jgi:hypothetical protein
MSQEEVLDGQLPEDVELLLEMNKLERMMTCDVNSGGDEGKGCERATELIHLLKISLISTSMVRYAENTPKRKRTYPVNKRPIKSFLKKRKLPQHSTEPPVLELL